MTRPKRPPRGPQARTNKGDVFGKRVPIDRLIVNDAWNARARPLPPEAHAELGRSMQFGQQQPCVGVTFGERGEALPTGPDNESKIRLIIGFQRYHAARAVDMEHLWVVSLDLTGARNPVHEAWLANRLENVARFNLSVAERYGALWDVWQSYCPDGKGIATRFDRMVADRCGVSETTVATARRLHTQLVPEIIAAWRGMSGGFALDTLIKWSQLAPPEQRLALAHRLSKASSDDDIVIDPTAQPSDLGKWGHGVRIPRARIRQAIGAFQRGEFNLWPKDQQKGAEIALIWAIGEGELVNAGLGQITFPVGETRPKPPLFDTQPDFRTAADAEELQAVPEYPDTQINPRKALRASRAHKSLASRSGHQRKKEE